MNPKPLIESLEGRTLLAVLPLLPAMPLTPPRTVESATADTCPAPQGSDSARAAGTRKVLSAQGGVLKYGDNPVRLRGYGDYGMVAEKSFQCVPFLSTLRRNRVNFTRVWVNYHWANGLSPFERVGNQRRFNLLKPNSAFYTRLRNFVAQAEARGIIVQVALFDGVVTDDKANRWPYSPYNNDRNDDVDFVQDPADFDQVGQAPVWQQVNKPLVQRVVQELGSFGNVIYEVANEPSADGHLIDNASTAFQETVARTLRESLAAAPPTGSKVISVNVDLDHGSRAVETPAQFNWAAESPDVDVLSFHLWDEAETDSKSLISGLGLQGLSKPTIISNDGDYSQMTYAQSVHRDAADDRLPGSGRLDRAEVLLRRTFKDESDYGHMHFEFLDKGLNGLSWTVESKDYQVSHTRADMLVLRKLREHRGRARAAADSASTRPGQAVAVRVLANDADPEGGALTLTGFTQPAYGTVFRSGDTLVYTPGAGFLDTDTFTYTIIDEAFNSVSALVAVRVFNNAPGAGGDGVSAWPRTPTSIPVLVNDFDPDGDGLRITAFTQPANGTVTRDPADPSRLVYTADFEVTAPGAIDWFSYTVADAYGAAATAGVAITIANQAPRPRPDAVTIRPRTAVSIPVLANDADPDGDALNVRGFTQPTSGVVHADPADPGRLIYTPNADFTAPGATDTFSYRVGDGHGLAEWSTVSVTLFNRPPSGVDDAVTTRPRTPVSVAPLANDSDPDGDALNLRGFIQPAHGTVERDPADPNRVIYTPAFDYTASGATDSFTYRLGDGHGLDHVASVVVTLANQTPITGADGAAIRPRTAVVLNVLGNDWDPDGDALEVRSFTDGARGSVARHSGNPNLLVYTPDFDFTTPGATDSFTYRAGDGHGLASHGVVTITLVNNAPVAVNNTVSTARDRAVRVNVLGNDWDSDGDSLNVRGFTQPANGTVARDPNNSDVLVYTPRRGFTGRDTFTYRIGDGFGSDATAAVTINIG